ncbi:Guanine nucleotide-binding protein G(T) subunit gamma-T1 [Apodemus speciosus]
MPTISEAEYWLGTSEGVSPYVNDPWKNHVLFYFTQGQKMPVINIEDLTEKDKLKMEVDQLKKEVTLERMMVSKCCEEVRDYIEERSGEDPLVKGIPEDKNPFKELKGGCVIS